MQTDGTTDRTGRNVEKAGQFELKQFNFELQRGWLDGISQPVHGSETAHGSGLDSYSMLLASQILKCVCIRSVY